MFRFCHVNGVSCDLSCSRFPLLRNKRKLSLILKRRNFGRMFYWNELKNYIVISYVKRIKIVIVINQNGKVMQSYYTVPIIKELYLFMRRLHEDEER